MMCKDKEMFNSQRAQEIINHTEQLMKIRYDEEEEEKKRRTMMINEAAIQGDALGLIFL